MQQHKIGGLSTFFNWIAKLAYINMLWLLFTIIGLILLGIGPATISAFSIIRGMLETGDDANIYSKFKQKYKQEFWNGNKLMALVIPVSVFIYFDFIAIRSLPSSFLIDYVVFPCLLSLTLLTIAFFSYLFAVEVHFQLPIREKIKYAVITAGAYPLYPVLMVMVLGLFALLIFIVPAIIPFYVVSLPIAIIQFFTRQSFKKLPNTSQKILT